MAKSDKKAMQYRLDGMTYAWDKIKQEGMEAFEKELKARRATFIPLEVDIEKVKEIYDGTISQIYNCFSVGVYKTLNTDFDFGKIRLERFRDSFNETCKDLLSIDTYGERLYTFSDYAKEFNEKYDLGIDLNMVQEIDMKNNEGMDKRASIRAIRELLEQFHFSDAAEFLEKYIEGDETYG